jgi:hypothetical protein
MFVLYKVKEGLSLCEDVKSETYWSEKYVSLERFLTLTTITEL